MARRARVYETGFKCPGDPKIAANSGRQHRKAPLPHLILFQLRLRRIQLGTHLVSIAPEAERGPHLPQALRPWPQVRRLDLTGFKSVPWRSRVTLCTGLQLTQQQL